MTKLIVGGIGGHMGGAVASIAGEYGFEVTAGFDIKIQSSAFPVYDDPLSCYEKADVIIDFSSTDALDGILGYAMRTNTPAVLAVTGYSPEQRTRIEQASKSLPIFASANMSLGINLLLALVKKCTEVLQEDFDIEIIEKHHNRKLDAPSGTALMLAQSISSAMLDAPPYVYGRTPETGRRTRKEIGIHAVRGGNIIGEHEVLFAGANETLSLTHTVASREVFAVGALKAARYLLGKENGLYDMSDLVEKA